jgi:hypothetical protein
VTVFFADKMSRLTIGGRRRGLLALAPLYGASAPIHADRSNSTLDGTARPGE